MSRFGPRVVRLHGGHLDLTTREGVRGGEALQVSPVEADVVGYLVAARRAVPEEELLAQVWGYHPTVRSATVKVTVARLRKKLEPDAARPEHVLTEKGAGYRWGGPPIVAPDRPSDAVADAPGAREERFRQRWELLGPAERAALRALSVFEGPFVLDAAEHVLGDGALDALEVLLERVWLERRADARLGLPDAVRGFLAEAGGPPDAARDAHLAWFARFGAPEVRVRLDHDEGAGRRALAADLPEIVAAVRRAIAVGRWEEGALALLAGFAGAELGLPRDALFPLAEALAGRLSPALEAELASELGEAYCAVDRVPEGRAACARGLALAREHGRWYAFARSALREAGLRFARGEVGPARGLIDEVLVVIRDVDAPLLHAMAWAELAGILQYTNDFTGAQRAARVTRASALRGGMPRMLGAAALASARAAVCLGEVAVAERALDEARAQMTRAGHAPMLAIVEAEAAGLHRMLGRFEEALACLARGRAIWAQVGRPQIALGLVGLQAEVLRRAGNLDGARAALREIHAAPGGFAAVAHTEQPQVYGLRAELEDPPEAALVAIERAEAQARAQGNDGARLQAMGRRVRILAGVGRRAEAEALWAELVAGREALGWGAAGNGVAEAIDEARRVLDPAEGARR